MATYNTDNFSDTIIALTERLTSIHPFGEVTNKMGVMDDGQPVATLRMDDDIQCWTSTDFHEIIKRTDHTAYFAVMQDSDNNIVIYIYKREY